MKVIHTLVGLEKRKEKTEKNKRKRKEKKISQLRSAASMPAQRADGNENYAGNCSGKLRRWRL